MSETTHGALQFWNTFGPLAQGVVVLLGVMSVLSIGVVVERGIALWIAWRDTQRFVPLASAALRSGILGEIAPLAEKCSLSPEAEIVRHSAVDLDAVPNGESEARRRFLLARWGVDRRLGWLNLDLRQGLPILGTIAATAPFVGLFGTVLGIIRAFHSLGRAGTGLAGVSQGIAEALIVTAIGLLVAIPATWAYNYFTERVDSAMRRARSFASVFLEAISAAGGAATRRLLIQEQEGESLAPAISRIPIKSEINVTPLVDVVLVLLIIFMVVTPLPQTAIELGISKTVRAERGLESTEKKDQVLLKVTAGNKLFVNDREIDRASLREALATALKGKTGQPLFFEADPLADYTQIVGVLDECGTAGIADIAIVNRKPATP